MSAELLLREFERLADAPDLLAQLRRFVLDLAMRGRLVRQDPTEEVESETPPVNKIAEPAKTDPYALPRGWTWSTLGRVSKRIHYGYTSSADQARLGVRLLRITDIQGNRVNWQSVPGCEISDADAAKYLLAKGDILIARTGGTMGKSFLISEDPIPAVFASYLIRVQPKDQSPGRYVKLFLDSPLYWGQLAAASRGTGQPNVNGKTLSSLQIPLAPRIERQRVVAKVDQLMELCDQLEIALASAQDGRACLLEALLHEALDGGAVRNSVGTGTAV